MKILLMLLMIFSLSAANNDDIIFMDVLLKENQHLLQPHKRNDKWAFEDFQRAQAYRCFNDITSACKDNNYDAIKTLLTSADSQKFIPLFTPHYYDLLEQSINTVNCMPCVKRVLLLSMILSGSGAVTSLFSFGTKCLGNEDALSECPVEVGGALGCATIFCGGAHAYDKVHKIARAQKRELLVLLQSRRKKETV